MQITEVLSGGKKNTPLFSAPPPSAGKPVIAFDTLFTQAERRTNPTPSENQSRERERESNSRIDAPRTRRESHTSTERSSNERERTTTEAHNNTDAANMETEAVYQPVPEDYEVDESEMLQAVAAVLQIPVEVLKQVLSDMGLEVYDLLEPANALKLIMQYLDVEGELELLTDPKFPEIYKKLNEQIAQAKSGTYSVMTETPEIQEARQDDAQITKAQNAKASLGNINLEGIEVVSEDGDVVAVQKADDSEGLFAKEGTDEDNITQTNVRAAATQTTASSTSSSTQTVTPSQLVQTSTETATQAPEQTVQIYQAPGQTVNSSQQAQQAMVRQAAAPAPVNTANVIEQIMSQVRVINSGGQFTEMRMTLRPESLGDIMLRVVTQNGIVIAQFEAESQRVKEALEASFNQLRDALTEAGIRFSELSVSVRQGHDERMNRYYEGRSRTRGRIESITDETLEDDVIESFHDGDVDLRA